MPQVLLASRFSFLFLATCCYAIAFTGCSSEKPAPAPVAEQQETDQATVDAPVDADKPPVPSGPVVLGNMIEPFDPPPLEELLESTEWEDRPVVDSLALMREHQASLPEPELTPEQALALRNDSPEANEKILDTLGRLAPADGANVNYSAELQLVAEVDLKSTNPLQTSSVSESEYNSLTSFGLFSFDWKLEKFAVSDAVVSWQSSKDRMMDKVVMRDDLTWSDGKPITAHDVAFSFKVLLTEEVPIPAMRQGPDQLRWVEAYDDHTLVYFHKEALATNDGNMNFAVIPKHIYEETIPEDPTLARSRVHTRLQERPVVGGPYKLVRHTRGQEFVLERREDYYMHKGNKVREQPYFNRVRYNVIEDRNTALLAVRSGDLDSMSLLAEQWIGQTNDNQFYRHNTKVSGVEWTTFHINWNLNTPYFEDRRVRQAMSYAIDYQEMLDTLLYGLYEQCVGVFHPDSRMFPADGPKPYRQDLDRAEELLEEAGWVDISGNGIREKEIDGRIIPFEFSLTVANMEDRVNIAVLIKESLEQIGVVCHVRPTEFTVLMEQAQQKRFHAQMAGWGTGADPDTTANIYYTGEPRNYGSYSNERVDELFELARREFDPEKRYAMYGEIHNILWEDQVYTWLYTRNSFYAFNKRLRGYNFSPRGPFSYGPGFSSIYTPSR